MNIAMMRETNMYLRPGLTFTPPESFPSGQFGGIYALIGGMLSETEASWALIRRCCWDEMTRFCCHGHKIRRTEMVGRP